MDGTEPAGGSLAADANQIKPVQPDKGKAGLFGQLRSCMTIAAAAFVLSLTLALATLLDVLTGASVTVLEPTHVYAYRSGPDEDFPLAIAVQIPMTNSSESYNDFLTTATLEISGQRQRFPVTMMITPTLFFTNDAAIQWCQRSDANCFALDKLAVVEREREPLTIIPGGAAHNLYYSFEVPFDCCQGCGYGCAVDVLRQRRDLEFEIHLEFHGDGTRTVRCKVRNFRYNRITDGTHFWQSGTCAEAAVVDTRPWYERWLGFD